MTPSAEVFGMLQKGIHFVFILVFIWVCLSMLG